LERLIESFARALVQDEAGVRVTSFRQGSTTVLELDVSPADRGRLIGRQGQTISALRTLLDAVAERRGEKFELELRE
jgi:predicted RNA-binding protein YlqC (UPF0109 family)